MISDALSIIVSSPSEQLKDDLKRHQVSISQFGRHLQSVFGNSASKAGADVAKMMTSVGVAFKDGILTTREYAEAMSQLKAAYKFAQASGESYDSMVREGAALNDHYASSLDQIAAKLAKLNALQQAGRLNPGVYQQAHDDITGAGDQRAAARAAAEAKAAEAKASELNHYNSLVDQANALNLKHLSGLEALKQRQLQLNTLRATGALTQQAYNAELRAANAIYLRQTSILAKLGFTTERLRGALTLINPWFIAAAGIGAGVKAAAEFEQAMSRVQAMTNASSQELRVLTDAAAELGRQTIYTSKQAADGLATFAMAGFTAKESVEAMEAAMRLATIGEMELNEAIEASASIMAGLKIPARDFADVVDAIAVAANASITSVEELAEAMKFVGPVAYQAGISLEETLAALMGLANAGMRGELGGTSLRNQLVKMANQSAEARAEMDKLGVAFRNADGSYKTLSQSIGQFEAKFARMGAAERLESASTIFEARASVGFLALVSQGRQQFEEMTQLVVDRANAAQRMENAITDNLIADTKLLGSALTGLATDLYEAGIGDVSRAFIISLAELANAIDEVVQFMKPDKSVRQDDLPAGFERRRIAEHDYNRALLQDGVGIAHPGVEFGTQDIGWGRWMRTMEGTPEALDAFEEALGHGGTELSKSLEKLAEQLDGASSKQAMDALVQRRQQSADIERMELQSGLAPGEIEFVKSYQEAVGLIQDAIKKRQEENELIELGREAVERRKLEASMLGEIEKLHNQELTKGAHHAAQQVAYAKEQLQLRLKLLAALQQEGPIREAVKKAQNALTTANMTEGQRAVFEATGSIEAASGADARRIDDLLRRAQVQKELNDLEAERVKLARQLSTGRETDKFDDLLQAARIRAEVDGVVTAEERRELEKLATIASQNRELQKQLELRKRQHDELVKTRDDLRQSAEALTLKMDPIREFTSRFVELATMFRGGLIDGETFAKARQDLLSDTLKSAGPKTIGFAGAVEEGTAEAYSASLRQTANPEFDELKRQTEAVVQSRDVLRRIEKGVANLKAEELDPLPPR